MAIFEYSGNLKYKDKAGNLHIMKPRTTSGNVEGLTQLLAEKENSGAAATALENAKAYTDQNISGKLDKPTNDATATAGQLLTKTANGQEWQDREKDLFIVTFTYNGDYHADKTFAEIKAAYNEGKMCYASLDGNICLRGVITNSYVTFIAFDVWGSSESIQTSMGFIRIYSDNSIVANAIRNQPFVTASGLLKGDGDGGVSAAVAGTDYVAPNGDASNVTAAFTAASTRANIATGEKLSVLFGKIAKWFADLGSLAFKSTVAKSDLASDVQTELSKAGAFIVIVTWDNTQRKYIADQTYANLRAALNVGKTCIAVYGGTRYICSTEPITTTSNLIFSSVEATSEYKMISTLTIASTDVISISSARLTYFPNGTTFPETLLKGTSSSGLISSAIPGTDYIASGNIVKQTLVSTDTTPTENYAINWVYG